MKRRDRSLQDFVDAAGAAFAKAAPNDRARRTIRRVFTALDRPGPAGSGVGRRLPACEHLDAALTTDTRSRTLDRLLESFRMVEPHIEWRRRSSNETASANFNDGHANGMILGPGGVENRRDVWLGATLMAPDVRYPDHDHAPEEVYLVLSDGEFRHGETDWFVPGVGGSFYNEPGIRHAMRSLRKPLLAFWALPIDH